MAAPASIRLPWRLLTRQSIINPVLSSTRAQFSDPVFSRRCLSDSVSPPQVASSLKTSAPEAAPGAAPTPNYPPAPGHLDPNDTVNVRLPRAVQAVYLRPLRRQAKYGVPSCDLQLRSYSVRNLEFFADFALRAAYYLNLPASGPVPLPRIVERWTVPRAPFIHKKSQENFERKTLRRLIQIKDGHPETVQVWLAFLKEHAYYGIGMKANVWNYEKLGVGESMDRSIEELKAELDKKWSLMGLAKHDASAEKIMEMADKSSFEGVRGGPKYRERKMIQNPKIIT